MQEQIQSPQYNSGLGSLHIEV